MKTVVSSFLIGLLFAFGLGISGMTEPSKVKGFLDLAGNWDPSLAFVMIGAIAVHFAMLRWILKRKAPLFSDKFQIPTNRKLDKRLLTGAAIFGIGWGLAGFCPAPALTSLATLQLSVLEFVVAMFAGMLLVRLV